MGWLATLLAPLKSNLEPRKQEDENLLCACYVPGTGLGSPHAEAVPWFEYWLCYCVTSCLTTITDEPDDLGQVL